MPHQKKTDKEVPVFGNPTVSTVGGCQTNKNSTNEIDFVIQTEKIHLIEVKAEENLKSKSLRSVLEEHKELEGWRFSMSPYRKLTRITNVPLYLIEDWLSV